MAWPLRIGCWLSVSGFLVAAVLSSGCRSSEVVFSDVPGAPTTGNSASAADARVFKVGDLVTIYYPVMQDVPEQHEERIKDDGTISLPLIGSITVAGKTARELQKELQAKYARFGRPFVVPPPYREDLFYEIGGEVKQEGQKIYLGETTLTKAIHAAGGFTDFANKKKIKLTHPDGRIEIVNVFELSKDPSLERRVLPGDIIFVPRRFGFGF